MKMEKVKSQVIQEVGHEGDILHVKFMNGQTYAYKPVSAEEYQELITAGSVGAHFARNIKKTKSFERLENGNS